MGLRYEDNENQDDFPVIKVAVSATEGDEWENDPSPGEYYTEADWFECKITVTDVYYDEDSDGVKDQGEERSVNTVYFDNIHTADQGSDTEWDTIISNIYSIAQWLSGVTLPFPFDLLTTDMPSSTQASVTYGTYYGDGLAGLRARIDYDSSETGDHYITCQTRTKVKFYVWHEDASKKSASVVDTEYITITKNFTLKLTVD